MPAPDRISLIDRTFHSWISKSPESFHPLDSERFYVLAKIVFQYDRSNPRRKGDWLEKKIRQYGKHRLSEERIKDYCNVFTHLIKFQKVVLKNYW